MSCEEADRVLLIDDDTVRTWHCLFQEDCMGGLAEYTDMGSDWLIDQELLSPPHGASFGASPALHGSADRDI